uniref:HECT-type E3 ubiquitin transferase n=1 Tax=Ciona savignyi TaxID=51511 RepID=H2Y3X9_CIOSA
MYSFEGNFRSSPEVSLGGRSSVDRLSKSNLLQKAHYERQKRENNRQRIKGAIILQSYIRSYLVRQKMKQQFRILFCNKKDSLNLVDLTTLLSFFYDVTKDSEYLNWLLQQILKNIADWSNLCP